MKIGVIGLGTIAQKAYLPLYTTRFSQHEWHFRTRNQEKLKKIGDKYGVNAEQLHTDWETLLEKVDAVCIHTPTETHDSIIRSFIQRSIPVLIDKPLTASYAQTKELIDLAKKNNTPVMLGFNRRFAPMIQKLSEIPDKNQLIVQKNQIDKTDFSVRFRIYDMMIHSIDTAVFLMNDTNTTVLNSEVIEVNGAFKRASVILKSSHQTAYVSINNEAGAKRETVELQSPAGTYTVENLSQMTTYSAEGSLTKTAGDWTETLEVRGFLPLIQSFVTMIEEGTELPVSYESVLLSHQICEEIISKHPAS
ncbi:Gfo/Idh/MocA family oxidoreductase [Alkalibacterium psychrotolerans]